MKRIHVVLFVVLALAALVLFPSQAGANTIQVGPGKQYATPCAAIAAAATGDTIQIDTSGSYSGDVCQWNTNSLTLTTSGPGRAVLNAAGKSSQGKAIWVISGNNTVVQNIEFTGAAVADLNGAGIRAEGQNLTIRNCFFHDNQEGILTDPGQNSTILIEFSEFARNGAGDGFSHNLYIGNIGHLIFRYNYSHSAFVGHLFKSRAAQNDILYNRFSDESDGTASYEIDISNGGKSFIIGNLIEQGPKTQNSAVIAYQEEGANLGNPDHELFVVSNTIVNDFTSGIFVLVDGSVTTPAIIKDNIFTGPGGITTQSSAVQANNFTGNAQFVNQAIFDYHLQSTSPAIDTGADPGSGGGTTLAPASQYVHPACAEGRSAAGKAPDIGAYEFGGGNGLPPLNAPARCGAPPPPAPVAGLSTGSVTFAPQAVGTTSSSQSVTLANSGNATLKISGISIAGINATDFAQTNSCGTGLAANASCSIGVTFTPSSSGNRSANLSVSDNGTDSPQSVGLSGSATAAAPTVSLAPTKLTFPSLPPGTTSASQVVRLTNSGNATLDISGIVSSGDFAQTNTCGSNLALGADCNISVTFTPTAGGTRSGTVSVTDDASGSPHRVTLTGTGLAPAPSASVSTSSLTFSSLLVGTSSTTQQVKLSNSGNAALSISGISASADFAQSNSCGASLGAGANCTIIVTFTPTAGGSRGGSISIADSASGSPQTVTLIGTGMDFSLASTANSATVTAGQSANFTMTVTPDGGFNKQITLTCSGAPSQATCSVSPSSVIPNGTATSSVAIAVSTTAHSSLVPHLQAPPTIRLRFLLVTLISVLLLLILSKQPRLQRAVLCSLALTAFTIGGCAGMVSGTTSQPPQGTTGTPAGSYSVTVKAASGGDSHAMNLALKVN